MFACLTRDDAALNRFAIYDDLLHSLLLALWVFHGDMILAATELGILIERIPTCCVGDKREEILVTQIVDPRPWSLWICNHVLAIGVIKMTILFLCLCLFTIYIVIYSCFELLILYSNYLI